MKELRAKAKAERVDMVVVEGARHTRVAIGAMRTVVPRHTEINEITAAAILKQMGVR